MMSLHVPRALRDRPRESAAFLAIGSAALLAAAGLSLASPLTKTTTATASTSAVRVGVPVGKPPAPEPLQFKQVTPDDARTINAVMPFSAAPNPSARPFAAKFSDKADEARALDCLTAAVYYEAAIEPPEGQRAVAQVVLNRLRHPAYPKTVCGVVFQGQERRTGCQFTFTCDGAIARAPNMTLWTRARAIAWAALSGRVFAPVGWATHYHTDWVVPYWASSLAKATKVGTHIFYRWTGGWGRAPAFTGRYAGVEPGVAKLAALSSAHGDAPVQLAAVTDAVLDDPADDDEIVVVADNAERMTMRLNVAAAAAARTPPAETKVPWELRWALTGVEPGKPEVAFGTLKADEAAPSEIAPRSANAAQGLARGPVAKPLADRMPSASVAKACTDVEKETKVRIPGSDGGAVMTVREKCGA